jgi:protein required for attachment to host cells
VASALISLHRAAPLKALVIVAPPRTLADLTHALPRGIRELTLAEIDKDLTKIPVYEIERHLTAA